MPPPPLATGSGCSRRRRRTQRRLLACAETIPDPLLRADALIAHHDKGSNSEGLAALAVLAPPEQRAPLARSLVSYQLMLDYLDGVSERPTEDPLANGLQLHRAFEVALDPDAIGADYYSLAPADEDGGYLEELIATCRAPLRDLPSYEAARAGAAPAGAPLSRVAGAQPRPQLHLGRGPAR